VVPRLQAAHFVYSAISASSDCPKRAPFSLLFGQKRRVHMLFVANRYLLRRKSGEVSVPVRRLDNQRWLPLENAVVSNAS